MRGFCKGGEQIVVSDSDALNFYSAADGQLVARYTRSYEPYYPAEAVSSDGRLFTYERGLNIFALSDGGTLEPVLDIPTSDLPASAYQMH